MPSIASLERPPTPSFSRERRPSLFARPETPRFFSSPVSGSGIPLALWDEELEPRTIPRPAPPRARTYSTTTSSWPATPSVPRARTFSQASSYLRTSPQRERLSTPSPVPSRPYQLGTLPRHKRSASSDIREEVNQHPLKRREGYFESQDVRLDSDEWRFWNQRSLDSELARKIVDREAKKWMTAEEERRKRLQKEAEKADDRIQTKRVLEEIERIKARIERARRAESDRIRQERLYRPGWDAYEAAWTVLLSPSNQDADLRFEEVPWPVRPRENITADNVKAFVLSSGHSQDRSRKEKVRDALRRWHPDSFDRRVLPKVIETDRKEVQAAVGVIARALNSIEVDSV